jgi:hypothetical protein
MVVVYALHDGPRLRYTCEVLFGICWGIEWRLTDRIEELRGEDVLAINYSRDPSVPGVQIVPSGFIKQRGMQEVTPEVTEWKGLPALFPTDGSVPFDLFSAAFFLLARYEEYQPYRADQHGRFPAESSFAHRNGFLEQPIVEQWVSRLKSVMTNYERTAAPLGGEYRFVSTIDVDSAFAYRYKGLMRTLGGFAKDILQSDWKNAGKRFRCITGRVPDPYNTYDQLHALHEKYDVEAIYFFLLADYGLNDKGVSHRSQPLQQLIRKVGDYYKVGIHPGFQSNSDYKRLEIEVRRMAQISRRDVERSRQHFLVLRFPETYRRLIALGIKEDHTLGYAATPGFRAGISRPFPFYDLERETVTPLILHPFAVMDATLSRYLELTPEEAIAKVRDLRDKVQSVSGCFTVLWHNESLSNEGLWKGWKEVYEKVLKIGKGHDSEGA